jgi:antitoxin VapB
MPFHIRDKETNALVRKLAQNKGLGLTDAVKVAVRNELQRESATIPLRDRLRAIADPIAAYPDTGLNPYKAFFDELSGH